MKPLAVWSVTVLLSVVASVSGGAESNTQMTVPNWQRLDAGPFSILAPSRWEFHQLEGVDSFVGEFVGDDVTLRFDFGAYSNSLKQEKKPEYVVVNKSISGFRAKIVSPRKPGHGITGVYFPRCRSRDCALSLGKRPDIHATGIGPEDV